jgi:hypothetical protein
MPVYSGKITTTAFKSGKNILASEHVQFIEGGATLDASDFGAGLVEVGTLIARDSSSGLWVEFDSTDVANYDAFGILNVDWECDGTTDSVVGEVIVRGSVYEDKLPANAGLDDFKELVPMIRFVKHV